MLKILYKSKTAIAVYKPSGMPSQPDPSGNPDAMTETSALLSKEGEDGSLWPVNRLDTVVSGIMLFARTKKAAAALSAEVNEGKIKKRYKAVVEGRASFGTLTDYIYKDARQNRAVILKDKAHGAKEASLYYKAIDRVKTEKGEYSLVEIELITGRFHQIRAQFSSRSLPIVGDKKYGSRDRAERGIALHSSRLCFSDGGRLVTVVSPIDKSLYPWSLFDFKRTE